ISLHPGGHSHGPAPGAYERSIGVEFFDELAVMVDTFRPLELSEGGRVVDGGSYAWTWSGRGPTSEQAPSSTVTWRGCSRACSTTPRRSRPRTNHRPLRSPATWHIACPGTRTWSGRSSARPGGSARSTTSRGGTASIG